MPQASASGQRLMGLQMADNSFFALLVPVSGAAGADTAAEAAGIDASNVADTAHAGTATGQPAEEAAQADSVAESEEANDVNDTG